MPVWIQPMFSSVGNELNENQTGLVGRRRMAEAHPWLVEPVRDILHDRSTVARLGERAEARRGGQCGRSGWVLSARLCNGNAWARAKTQCSTL